MTSPLLKEESDLGVAVIGMAARFPGASNVDEFWKNLRDGVESISFFSDEELLTLGVDGARLNDPNYVKASGVLEDIEMFDAAFFGFSPREAEITDPQQRLFLECAWAALEHAGYDPKAYDGHIGVYASASLSSYLINVYSNNDVVESVGALQALIGNDKDYLPTRVSYKFDLTGPSVAVQTACSSSLVAVHLACQSLRAGECDIALAGGVSISSLQKQGYVYREGGILSPDGHCRAFDAGAKGAVKGNGVGVVVLKRLADACADRDSIQAVIRGSAVNNDGSSKAGFTAPSIHGQARVIAMAQALADVEADTVNYVEAHGTGTQLGDPIEIEALTKAFCANTDKKGFCAIGSVKTNIGHLDTAAGVAGLIKTVLALQHKCIPPSLHFEEPNPRMDLANSAFYVNTSAAEWKPQAAPRRAGVSSFGIGGTNAHIIVEEASEDLEVCSSRPWQLLVLSARTDSALEAATANLFTHLRGSPGIALPDVAYTLQVGRRAFKYRLMVVCRDCDDAINALEPLSRRAVIQSHAFDDRRVVFMFSGQGTQRVNMGLELYETEPVFREQIDYCSKFLMPALGVDLRDCLYPGNGNEDAAGARLNQTSITQPALFMFEYALAVLWGEFGVRPSAMIGHSIGEYVAACFAGVFSLEDGLRLVMDRGRLIQSLPAGAMLAVALPEADVLPLLDEGLCLAAVNHPSVCAVSGPISAVDGLRQELYRHGVKAHPVQTSHAFHSGMLEPALVEFREVVKSVKLHPPQIPLLSNLTGKWLTDAEAIDPGYWVKHLRETVRFAEGIGLLLNDPDSILLEVGAGHTLTNLAKRNPGRKQGQIVLSSLRVPEEKRSDCEALLETLGRLWVAGKQVNWRGFYGYERRRRIPLPTYPFERQRYWLDPIEPARARRDADSTANAAQTVQPQTTHSRPALTTSYAKPKNEAEQALTSVWQSLFGMERIGIDDDFFELGGDSLLGLQLISHLKTDYGIKLSLHDLFGRATIAKLTELIHFTTAQAQQAGERSAAPPPSSLLVEIIPGSSARTLFLVHPIGGGVYGYRGLARLLELALPVFGIQAHGLNLGTDPFRRIEPMAACYLESMRTQQHQGPYLLGGASFGGIVAFEMAQQLRAQGEEVALLVLLDSPGPGQMPINPEDDAALLAHMLQDIVPLSSDNLRGLDRDQLLTHVVNEMTKAEKLPSGIDLSYARRLFDLWKANFEAMLNYCPRAYEGRTLYLRAADRSQLPQHPELPWIEVAAGGIEIHSVPGTHTSMLDEPNVRVLAEKLRACIGEAQRIG